MVQNILANNDKPCSGALWRYYHRGKTPVVPDIKCKSPGEGDLLMGRDPVATAKSLQEAGAPMLSVVTEEEHFGGSLDLLAQVAGATGLPVLRKDFITSRQQLVETREHGAKGVLLIAAILTEGQLPKLVEEALSLGLEPLVEIHNEEELREVGRINSLSFLGINNRNILEWEMDDGNVNTTEKLAGLVPPEVFLLSESSITGPGDVRRAREAGAHGVLVGTAILKAGDPVAMYHLLTRAGGKAHD